MLAREQRDKQRAFTMGTRREQKGIINPLHNKSLPEARRLSLHKSWQIE
jgi:hypothetical protein